MKLIAPWLLGLAHAFGSESKAHDYKQVPIPQPHFVVPESWATDASGKYLLLPLSLSEGLSPQQCKVLSNSDKILVVVTEQPQEQPETAALRKYRLIVEAFKVEAGHDEQLLQRKYLEWLDTEEDDEVRVYVQSALDSLQMMHAVKHAPVPQTVTVSLGLMQMANRHFVQAPEYPPSSVLQLRGKLTAVARSAAVPANAQQIGNKRGHVRLRADGLKHAPVSPRPRGMVRESFAIDVPYPAPLDKVFLFKASENMLIVVMPLLRDTLGAQGISTGGIPFARAPVFDESGRYLAGPKGHGIGSLAAGLDLVKLRSLSGIVPLAA